MCFHTSQTKKVVELENRYRVSLTDEKVRALFDEPRYHLNGFAHPGMLIIPQEEPSKLTPSVWGIVPESKNPSEIGAYYKEAVRFGGGLNARSERIFDHFIYKKAVFTRRCIIPITGFFEPHEHLKKKYPYYISKKDHDVLSLAGLYSSVGHLLTFTVLTKDASPLLAKIHNQKKRQPVLLTKDAEAMWLKDDLDLKTLKQLIGTPYPDSELLAYPVSKDLFNPKADSNNPSILNPVEYETGLFGEG